MSKLTVEQKIQKAHVSLMNDPKYCLYSGIFMLGKTTVSDDVSTACTDGINTIYGRKFMGGLSEEKIKAVVLHENLHKAFRHMFLWKPLFDENPQLANMACDFVINLMIYDSDTEGKYVKLPEICCFDEQYRGMDAGTVFRLLKKKCKGGKGGNGDGKGNGSGEDEEEGGEGFDEHNWEGSEGLSEDEKQAIARDVDQALRQGAILAGKLSGNIPREITDAMEPKVDWRVVLHDFVTSICVDKDNSTWRRPNRRWVDQGIYMPSTIGEAVGRGVIAIDMSGSIGMEEIGQFLGEFIAICKHVQPESIDLLYWDTEVCQHESYERSDYDNIMASTKPKGGGGTEPACIPKYLEEHKINPEFVVVLTDGYVGSWGTWKHPVFWGITSKNVTADCGTSIYVGE